VLTTVVRDLSMLPSITSAVALSGIQRLMVSKDAFIGKNQKTDPFVDESLDNATTVGRFKQSTPLISNGPISSLLSAFNLTHRRD